MANNVRPFQTPDGDRRANRVIFRRTMFLMVLFGVFIFFPLLWKLWDIQIANHDFYEEKAIQQQTGDKAVAAKRGTIYDSKGNVLAISATVHDIIVSPRDVVKLQKAYAEAVETAKEKNKPYPDYPEPTNEFIAQGLSEILGVEKDDILSRLAKTQSAYQVVAKKTEEDVSTRVREFITKNHLATGIVVQPTTKRYYPYSTLAAQVIGFVNSENEGAYGLEAMYEQELSGSVGRVVTAKNGAGTEMLFRYEDYIDALDGCDLTLTLNATIQHYCEKILAEGIAKFDVQNGGFAIAMDPNTGAILGWANSPTYDLNNPSTIYDENLLEGLALLKESATDEAYSEAVGAARNKQWRNKAVNDSYEPGSTFKSVVLAAALEAGVVDESTTFHCTGKMQVPGYTIRCHKREGHGSETLAQAVMNSCNPAFVAIGQKLGAERLYQYMKDFGLMNLTGVDMQGESGSVIWSEDLFTSEEGISSVATASFGQRFQVTPLQMLCATSAVINGGHLLTPHVLDSITDSEGNVIKHVETQEVRQVISEQTSQKARTILEQVVGGGGTGKNAYVAGYRIGGKTGSSQTLEVDHTIVSFLGFAPADDPKVIVLLAYDNPKPSSPGSNYTSNMVYISGGNMAAPMAGALLADILDYMGVEKQYTESELTGADTVVPKVTQFPLAESERLLKKAGFTWRTVGDGASVTDQIPAAGATIPGGSEVILYLGEPKPEGGAIVPDVSGKSAQAARDALSKVGLYMKATGSSGYYTSATVAGSQSIAAGSEVELGSVVEVRFVDNHIYD